MDSAAMGRIASTQNIELADKTLRFIGGGALITHGVLINLVGGYSMASALAVIAAIYPLITAMIGWDPFYEVFLARSRKLEAERNQCGTLQYEADAALGYTPMPSECEYDHSLAGYTYETHRLKKVA